ncbi:MAG: cell wall metabolism sensor histidine kinase WalK [Chloroflexi bacterium]|nr:cell wall metabolism sensor histidine kinase WalK [Chloroflexota bacterium]
MFSSIRLKLSLSHLAVIALAMGLSAYLLLSFLEDYFVDASRDSLTAQARLTAQALIPQSIPEDRQDSVSILQTQTSAEQFASGTMSSTAPVQVFIEAEPQTGDWTAFNNTMAQTQKGGSNFSVQASNIDLDAQGRPPASPDLTYLSNASLQLSAQLQTRIRILDTRGTVIADSWQQEQGTDLASDPAVSKALGGETASRTARVSGEQTMCVALPAMIDGQPVGIVYLSQPLRDMTAVLHDVRTRLLISTGVAALLSGMVALVFSRAISNPLRRLTAAAGAVAQGRLDQQVPVRSRDEIGRLSQTFNEMTERLRLARQTQIDFVANVSHESRTPLTTIKGMAETLREGAADDPEVRDRFLSTIESETNRLIRLVNDLLLLSRADSGALDLRREPVDLAALARSTVEQLTHRAGAHPVTLSIEANAEIPCVDADPDRVRQVLVNLIDNAIKYSRPGGVVSVAVAPGPERSALVQVRDQGIGIPAQDLPHIGERFYRTDKARSRTEGGTGLGLAIARALIEAHGGRLWLESKEGKGTTVSFTLPSA